MIKKVKFLILVSYLASMLAGCAINTAPHTLGWDSNFTKDKIPQKNSSLGQMVNKNAACNSWCHNHWCSVHCGPNPY